METFQIRDLSFSYPGRPDKALDHLSLTVEAGEFLLLCGPSGGGKSTLLRQLKPMLTPNGTRSGSILLEGRPLEGWDHREQSRKIGFVLQDPDNQLVTDKVWHELAFGLESLGYNTPTIRRRVAEMAAFFGIEEWFHRDVASLSGGQKQLLNLAAVMVLQPSVLLLDEPTSQLDPIAAGDFLTALSRINRELGTTVILSEHRLEEALPLATRAAVLEQGRLLAVGTPRQVGAALRQADHAMFRAMPTAMRVWAATQADSPCPLTVREGRDWLEDFAARHPLMPLPPIPDHQYTGAPVLNARGLWFRYEQTSSDVVQGLSLSLRRGEFLALLGGNGAGKTTTLKLLGGLLAPQRGAMHREGRVALLPQSPQALFVKKTVGEDLHELLRPQKLTASEAEHRVARVAALCHLNGLLDRHPYDLSGGEQQRAALAKVLLLEPDILLLDEPTKGLDAAFKDTLASILCTLLAQGVAIVMVSHDLEFCARHAHRCALFFDGGVVAEGVPRDFFSGNRFYTTAANRMARPLLPQAITAEDLIAACGGTPPPAEEPAPAVPPPSKQPENVPPTPTPPPLPLWRKVLALLSGGAVLALLLHVLGVLDLSALIGKRQLHLYGLLLAALFILAASLSRPRETHLNIQSPVQRRTSSGRARVAAFFLLLLIPLTLFYGVFRLDGKQYYTVALLVLLEAMLPFFLLFEGRKPQARELVLLAALCALGVAGRAALFMLPQFKPVLALAILSGIAFGRETGFLVGAMTMLVSNMLFSQGPWTPWQMFAAGLIGFLAGIVFRAGRLRPNRSSMALFGALSAVVLYGGIMNPASYLIWAREWNWLAMLPYFLSGFPMDCVHGGATALFLWVAGEPMLEKLERINVKYGLV